VKQCQPSVDKAGVLRSSQRLYPRSRRPLTLHERLRWMLGTIYMHATAQNRRYQDVASRARSFRSMTNEGIPRLYASRVADNCERKSVHNRQEQTRFSSAIDEDSLMQKPNASYQSTECTSVRSVATRPGSRHGAWLWLSRRSEDGEVTRGEKTGKSDP
jgi:hypothetical protein